MAALSLYACLRHIPRIIEYPTKGEIRPACRTCEWKGPMYGKGDYEVAMVGAEAHCATETGAGALLYKILIDGNAPNALVRAWSWEDASWQ